MAGLKAGRQKFFVELIRPSHYDDDGYVIQWRRAFVPSNSLACLYALIDECAAAQTLGDDVEIVPNAYDESHTVIPVRKIIRRIRRNGNRGVVLLVGVQTNQFPRAMDLAQEFRRAGVAVIVGGFHVSGCLAMLRTLPPELQALQAQGVSLFAGEAEGRIKPLLDDAYHGRLQPVYNYLGDLPSLTGHATPRLPRDTARRSMFFAPIDAGRGCPYTCSFCTIINVQGRKSRHRSADDIGQAVRGQYAQGIRRFFITDDNLARNRNWEPIFDRLIALREDEGLRIKFMMQIDTQAHRLPRFVEKATRAGCSRVFIGMESVNPQNLTAAGKRQNHADQYRDMLLAWRARNVLTHAGYILGFPADTPDSIEADIDLIKRELPIDVMEFFVMTALPGSADHRALYESGAWLEPDLNNYDSEHVTTEHPAMDAATLMQVYHRAWRSFYSPEHLLTLLRRAHVNGAGIRHMAAAIMTYYGSYRYERIHPLQCGLLRRKDRATQRPGWPRESFLRFYSRRIWETAATLGGLARFALHIEALRRQIERDPQGKSYSDLALTPAALNAPGLDAEGSVSTPELIADPTP